MMNRKEMLEKANTLFAEAKGLLELETVTAEDAERRDKLLAEAKDWHAKAAELKKIQEAALAYETEMKGDFKDERHTANIKNVGEWLIWNHRYTDTRYRGPMDPRAMLGKEFNDPDEADGDNAWLSKKATGQGLA